MNEFGIVPDSFLLVLWKFYHYSNNRYNYVIHGSGFRMHTKQLLMRKHGRVPRNG